MKKRVSVLLSVCSLSFIALNAQTSKIDSLRHAVKTAKEDTGKVNALNALAFALSSFKPDSTILLARQAGILAVNLKFTSGEANAYGKTGVGFWVKGSYDTAIKCETKALKMYEALGDKRGQAINLANLGNVHFNQGDLFTARDFDMKALKMAEEIGDKRLQSIYQGNLGNIYNTQGDYAKAIDYYLGALKMVEQLGDKAGQARTLGNIGTLYRSLKDYAKALDYGERAMNLSKEIDDKQGVGRNLCNIGNVYHDQKDLAKAISYYQQALKIAEETGNKAQQADNLCNIGSIYQEQNNYSLGLEFYSKALKKDEELGDKRGQASDNGVLGVLNFRTGKFKDAEMFFKKAALTDSAIGDRDELRKIYEALSRLDDTTGNSKLALNYYKESMVLKDTLFNIDKNKALTRKELTYEFDKKQAAEKAEQDKKDALADADKRKQTIIIWSTIAGLLLVMVFAGFIFRSLRTTRKQKDIIEIKNKETEEQKKVIEEKNKDIIDSINYAKRLQEAILPPLSLIKQTLPESFVLYKPKDIVAGDFYWMERVTSLNLSQGRDFERSQPGMPSPLGEGQDEVILIAAADCTGHGVPGALVSVVCSNALNRTVKEFKITEPGKILDKVRELVLETFEKSEDNVQDGMDISLCAITLPSVIARHEARPTDSSGRAISQKDKRLPRPDAGSRSDDGAVTVSWAGAYNSLWYTQNNEMKEVVADKQPIGKTDKPTPFNTYSLKLQKGDMLYLFTDGYADQFGGPKGKKFKYAQLQQLIMDNARPNGSSGRAQLTMEEQKTVLEKKLNEWKGELEQVDDILIIGIRV